MLYHNDILDWGDFSVIFKCTRVFYNALKYFRDQASLLFGGPRSYGQRYILLTGLCFPFVQAGKLANWIVQHIRPP